MIRLSTPALACSVALLAGPASGAKPTVVDMGTDNLPQAVSDNGRVVVGISIGENVSGVFRWTPKGLDFIGGVAAGRPDVSADGSVIAGTVFTDRAEAAYWMPQTGWTPLSETELVPARPGWDTYAEAISANGKRLSGTTVPPPVDFGWIRAFSFNPDTWIDRWADFGWQELPLGGKSGFASAQSTANNGRVQVGLFAERGGWFQAARWVDGRFEALVDGDGQRLGGESVVCNSRCNVIVGGGGGSSAVKPVLAWRLRAQSSAPACHFEPLAGPPLPALRHYAYSTSEKGDVVIGAYYYDIELEGFIVNVARGFLWLGDARSGTMVDLQRYLSMRGQHFLDDWFHVIPVATSGDGRYLVGWGEDAKGQFRGWRIDFGRTPETKDPLPSDSSHTQCPTSWRVTPQETQESTTDDVYGNVPAPSVASQPGAERMPASAAFRKADGHHYYLSSRGPLVYGGISEQRLEQQRLVPLGHDRYFDLKTRTSLSVVRNASGNLVGLRATQAGKTAIWHRRDQ